MVEAHLWLCWAVHPVAFRCPAECSPPHLSGTRYSHSPSPSLLVGGPPTLPSRGLPSALRMVSQWVLQMTSAPVTVHSFLCPQGNLGPHCDRCRVTGNRMGWGPAGKRDFCPPSSGLLSHIRSPRRGMPGGLLPTRLPVPVLYHPPMLSFLTCLFLTAGLLELSLPPQRPLQELEGMGFSSFSCLAVGTHHSMPLAFLRCHQVAVDPRWA